MITVKLFGLLRLDAGVKELQADAANVRQLRLQLPQLCSKLTPEALRGCVVLVNGQPAKDRTKLTHGDVVTLLSPVAGG